MKPTVAVISPLIFSLYSFQSWGFKSFEVNVLLKKKKRKQKTQNSAFINQSLYMYIYIYYVENG